MSCNASSNAPQNDNPSLSIAFTNGNRRSASDALSPRRNDWDVAALCLCSLANAFVLINVFPYSGFMVLFLLPSTTPETTGTYAGFLASSFMIGRCVTAVEWGKIADRYGRVCVLQASLVLSAVFCILFGTSQSYRMALVWRFCLGAVNAITSTTKTLASEIGHGNEEKERRAMGLVVGMRSWGFLIGPAIGGILSEPLKQYPSIGWLQSNGWCHATLEKFPFLLPNVAVALFCLGGAASATWFIEETVSTEDEFALRKLLRSISNALEGCWTQSTQWLPCCCGKPHTDDSTIATIRNGESQGLLSGDNSTIPYGINGNESIVKSPAISTPSDQPAIWSRNSTRQHLIVNWIFSFVVTFIDEAFPLYCMSNVGGLGLTEASIGKILSLAGLLFAMFQYVVYATITDRMGLYSSIEIGCLFGLVPASLIPLSLWLSRRHSNGNGSVGDIQQQETHLSIVIVAFLSILLGFCKIMACMCFSSLAIATNKTVHSSQRAKMNGLSVVGASITKGAAPIFGGALVSFSFSSSLVVPPEYGSIVIFSTIGILGFIVWGGTLRLERHSIEST